MASKSSESWTVDVERVCFIFKDLQSSQHDILMEDVILPSEYALEIGWRGESTPEIWTNLVSDTFGPSAASFWTAEKFVESFSSKEQQFDKENGLFFITHGGRVVASAFAWLDTVPTPSQPVVTNGRVHFVCVAEAHRRRGLARALMQRVLRYHRAQGRQAAALRTEVYRRGAISLYEKLGFRRCSMDEVIA